MFTPVSNWSRTIFHKLYDYAKLIELQDQPVVFQFQLIAYSDEPATAEKLQENREIFLELRETIREKSLPAFRKLMGE